MLSNAALYIFIPALLLRTTIRLDFATLPWRTLGAFFVPAVALLLAVYAWQRWRGAAQREGAAAPAVRAISASFGNSVQLGIPLAAALFGEAGLAIHVALISLHALILLSLATALAELDLARAPRSDGAAASTLRATLRQHAAQHRDPPGDVAGAGRPGAGTPAGLGLHPVVDETLLVLGSAVVPVCLVLIGLSLAYYGVQGHLRGALGLALLKLLGLPALVLVVAHWGFGLAGLPLAVLVVMASLPVGSNPLIFAQRYDTLQGEATAAIVFSTLAFVATLAGLAGAAGLAAGPEARFGDNRGHEFERHRCLHGPCGRGRACRVARHGGGARRRPRTRRCWHWPRGCARDTAALQAANAKDVAAARGRPAWPRRWSTG